jgi:hypothetical protein
VRILWAACRGKSVFRASILIQMPAIHPPRLKIQASELIQSASDPEAFCHAYHDFLDYYADRTYRPGKVGEPPPLLPAYQVPKPVSRVVEKELAGWAAGNREQALALADALWGQAFLEFRTTAAILVGLVEPVPVKQIFSRIENWITPSTEERLVNVLINSGLRRILTEYQDLYFAQIDIWLRSRSEMNNRLGLKACLPLLDRKDFEDYPRLFKRLGKFLRSSEGARKSEALLVLDELTVRAPEETAVFLENALRTTSDNQQVAWFVRKTLPKFQGTSRQNLRQALQETGL